MCTGCPKALFSAACDGDVSRLGTLLEAGVHPDDYRDPEGHTALHKASERGHVQVVKMLLMNGARVTTLSRQGKDALHFAMQNEQKEVEYSLRTFKSMF